jgi:hypothetical protein
MHDEAERHVNQSVEVFCQESGLEVMLLVVCNVLACESLMQLGHCDVTITPTLK